MAFVRKPKLIWEEMKQATLDWQFREGAMCSYATI